MNTKRLRQAWLDWLVQCEHTHALTLKPNPFENGFSMDVLQRLFCKVHMLVDRALLGRRFNLPSRAPMRTGAVAIIEGLPNTGHIHAAFKVQPAHWAKFEGLFADGSQRDQRIGIWRKLVPHGTAVVEPIYEPGGWYDYSFKGVWMTDDADRIVFPPLPVIAPAPRV